MDTLIPRVRRAFRCVVGKDAVHRTDLKCRTIRLGNPGASWTVAADELDRHSVVFSFGIGEDISFDLALIRRFGCTVHGFDPTPRSLRWVEANNPSKRFIIHDYGLGVRDETVRLHPPADPGNISHSRFHHREASIATIELPVRSLRSALRDVGVEHLAILKLDIEGMEYDVLPSILEYPGIAQLLVEFHHRFEGIGIRKTLAAVGEIRLSGYRLFHVSATGEEFSFLRTGG